MRRKRLHLELIFSRAYYRKRSTRVTLFLTYLPRTWEFDFTILVTKSFSQVLHIVPNEGTVPPYTVHHVHIGFHGFEPLRVNVTAICQILHGPTEEIRIVARADAIKFSINTDVIDFGQQVTHGHIGNLFLIFIWTSISLSATFDRKSFEINRIRGSPLNEILISHILYFHRHQGDLESFKRHCIFFKVKEKLKKSFPIGSIDPSNTMYFV